MQTHKVTVTTYDFDELSDAAKTHALEKLYDINVDFTGWAEFVLDDAKEWGAMLGIEIEDIFYSGFSSQGDGACFTGRYYYKKGSQKAIREHAPQDDTLHAIADGLAAAQASAFYRLEASVSHRGHYYHELCTDITVDNSESYAVSEDNENAITEALRDFMRWIYSRLETQYYYLTSESAIVETIKANEYQFTENGNLY